MSSSRLTRTGSTVAGAHHRHLLGIKAVCLLLYCAALALVIYGLSIFGTFQNISYKSSSLYYEREFNRSSWDAQTLGLRFMPPLDSLSAWLNTGCDVNSSVLGPVNTGCKFAALSSLDVSPQQPPPPFFLFGSMADPQLDPEAPIIITSLSIALYGAIVGLVGLLIELLELRGCCPPHVLFCHCDGTKSCRARHVNSWFVLDTIITVCDAAFVIAVFVVGFTSPSTSSLGFFMGGASVNYTGEALNLTNDVVRDLAPTDFLFTAFSATNEILSDDSYNVWERVSYQSGLGFRMPFTYTSCVNIEQQLAWFNEWLIVFNNMSSPSDAAFWEICPWENVSFYNASCISYVCQRGVFRTTSNITETVNAEIQKKLRNAIAFDVSSIGCALIAYILLYVVSPAIERHDEKLQEEWVHAGRTESMASADGTFNLPSENVPKKRLCIKRFEPLNVF